MMILGDVIRKIIMHESVPLNRRASSVSGEDGGWKSCCFDIDSRFCRFAVCMVVSVCTLLAGLCVLVTEPSCDTYGFWGPIITLIIGIWTPTPKKSLKK